MSTNESDYQFTTPAAVQERGGTVGKETRILPLNKIFTQNIKFVVFSLVSCLYLFDSWRAL